MHEISDTQSAYTRIAAAYAAATADRGPVARQMRRFCAWLPPGGLVLDAGCGPGYDSLALAQGGLRPVGVDLSWQMLHAGRQLGHATPLMQADFRHLPLAAETAVGIWACASLLHVPRALLPAVLREFGRVLQPDGLLYLSVKLGADESWAETAYGQPARRFFVYWQPAALDPLLAAAGFRRVDGWQEPTADPAWLVRFARKTG
ncbi:MAG: class I SAM-dependent methyltransferase [Anaerolineales bacterium]|nr:class I SAM-dependent methyltransferase [Anaerolineales bacterium]